jgi:hypothetical protein
MSLPSYAATALPGTHSSELEGLGLHRWEFYYKERNYCSVNWSVPPSIHETATVNPGGTSINITIHEVELAGIVAALINEHTHSATDSAGALWQIRNSILYPQAEHETA